MKKNKNKGNNLIRSERNLKGTKSSLVKKKTNTISINERNSDVYECSTNSKWFLKQKNL